METIAIFLIATGCAASLMGMMIAVYQGKFVW